VGRYSVRAEADTSVRQAYAFSVFMLQEESTDPTITLSGTPLSDFSSQPGMPSAEQSYIVSGSNLTEDIVITAPTDFEISTTSGGSFTTTLILTQSASVVDATPIYAPVIADSGR
jgi:hypothetical protein